MLAVMQINTRIKYLPRKQKYFKEPYPSTNNLTGVEGYSGANQQSW
jgi:hypothetical protein